MPQILIESEALDSLKRMVEELQRNYTNIMDAAVFMVNENSKEARAELQQAIDAAMKG